MKQAIFIKVCLLLSIWLQSVLSYAQNEGNIWYFGYNAGIDFNSGEAQALTNSGMYTWEGCASISDLDGTLLFYTNGLKVWNANHVQMTNGFGLLGHDSSSQSAVIVKKPGPNLIYLIFTVDAFGYEDGLRYSEVDMALEGGLGAINENKNVLVVTPTAEKITAIQHENQMDYWIVTHLVNSSSFHCYLLNEDGLSTDPVVSTLNPFIMTGFLAIGYLRANRIGNRIALAGPGLWTYYFNKTNGELSDPMELDLEGFREDYESAYGVEFSKNGDVLYASIEDFGDIIQYDLSTWDIDSINDSKYLVGSCLEYGGAIQRGPDDKIYHASWNSEYLGVIENPEVLGENCSYLADGFFMDGKVTGIGLPNFKNSIFNVAAFSYENLCLGELTEFTLHLEEVDSVFWDFGDSLSLEDNYSSLLNPSHYYEESGFYAVTLKSYVDTTLDILKYWLYIKTPPIVELGNDTSVCEGQEQLLDATTINATYLWQDQSTEATYLAINSGQYYVDVTQNSCTSRGSILLDGCDPKLEMPNVFTPNGDGANDIFLPLVYEDIREATISIYNRWGLLMIEDRKLNNGWDGNVDERKCSEGTYYYIILYKGINNEWDTKKGYLNLLR